MNRINILGLPCLITMLIACGGQQPDPSPSSDMVSSSSSIVSSVISSSSSSSSLAVPTATPAELPTDRWYVLTNRSNNLALDFVEASRERFAGLTQATRTNSESQQFRLVDSGERYYRLIARHSGLALGMFGFSIDDGVAHFVQNDDLNSEVQQFQILDLQNGYYQLENRWSGKVLAPALNSAELAGSRITQFSKSGDPFQQWQLVDYAAYSPTGECGAGTAKARVTGEPGNYQMNGQNFGDDYRSAIFAAMDSLTPGRTKQERIVVMASGDIGDARINLKSHTIFEVCGTMNVAPASQGSITIWGSATENISIPFLNMTGTPSFAMLIADTRNLHLGQIDLRLDGGGGIRFDNRGVTNEVQIDNVYVEGTSGHGVETWNIDGLKIGTVIARNTGSSGLLLNNSRNAIIGTVDGQGTGNGTGYATLRFANTNGQVNNRYLTNILVDKVISRGGARGIFCVSQSGGVRINSIDLADNGNNSILIENCYNVRINGGTIIGGGELRLAARSEFDNNRDITISNVAVRNTSVRESPCGENVTWDNVTVENGDYSVCN